MSGAADSGELCWHVQALATILLRAGLEMDFAVIRKAGWTAVRLVGTPGPTEAVIVMLLARSLFNMPWSLAMSFGFIQGAVAPAVVILGMVRLVNSGYAGKKGEGGSTRRTSMLPPQVPIRPVTLCPTLQVSRRP